MDLNKVVEEKLISRTKLAKRAGIDDSTLHRYLKSPPRSAVEFINLLLTLGICPRDYVNSVKLDNHDCPDKK